MKAVASILTGLAALLVVKQAHAETRGVLILVKQHGDGKASVTIYSEEKQDRRSAVSVAAAVKALAGMRGWGSKVNVYVTSDRGGRRDDVRKLLGAILDNGWLDLEFFGREVPKGIGGRFLGGGAGR